PILSFTARAPLPTYTLSLHDALPDLVNGKDHRGMGARNALQDEPGSQMGNKRTGYTVGAVEKPYHGSGSPRGRVCVSKDGGSTWAGRMAEHAKPAATSRVGVAEHASTAGTCG